MKKRLKTLLITIEILIAVTFAAFLTEPIRVQAQATPQIMIEPDSYQAQRIGETFSLDVNIYDLEATHRAVGVQFRVPYNDTLLEGVNVTEGPFMGQFNNTVDPPYTHFTSFIEDDPIYGPNVLVGILLIPNGTGYWKNFPEGNGTLATVTFRTIYRPIEPDTITSPLNLNDTMIMDEDLNQIAHTATGTTYEALQILQPNIDINPPNYTASLIGETFDVNVDIEDLDRDLRLAGLMFRVQYDGEVLEALDVTEGPFMGQFNNTVDPPYTYFIEYIEDDPIYGPNVLVGILLIPNGTGYWKNFPEGNGTLATITFKAINQTGQPDPPVSSMLVLNGTQLIDDMVAELPHTTTDGYYEIEPLTFSYQPDIPFAGEPVHFIAPEANYSVTYSWNFGDGTSTSTTEHEVGHIYSMTGEYNVTLTCMTDNITTTVTQPISIWPPKPTMDVTIDVGSMHFSGEIAEFNILTSNHGEAVNATQIEAFLYHNSVLQADLTASVQHAHTGYYTIPYNIPVDAEAGTYTLVLEVQYYNAKGTSMKSFQISETLTGSITGIQDDIATILTDLNYVKMNLTAIQATLVNIENNIATINTTVGILQTDVANIDATLTDVHDTTATIDSQIGSLQTDVNNINATLVNVEDNVATIHSTIGDIQTDVSNINAEVTDIKGDVATISTTIGDFETKLEGIHGTATTTLYAASIISAIAAILAAVILMKLGKK